MAKCGSRRGLIMAVAGLVAFLLILAACLAALGWRKNAAPPALLWEPRSFAASYTSVVGPLAAFSVASAIFMAGISVNRQTLAFETMIGMLLIAYIVFTGTAMMFASTPGPIAEESESFRRLQRYSIAVAMLGYGIGVSIAWLTLSPLLKAIDLVDLSGIFIWILLVTTFAAASRWSLFMFRLFEVPRVAAILMPFIAFVAAGIYFLLAARVLPQLWPAGNAPLALTILLFAIVVLGFGGHSLMLCAVNRGLARAPCAPHHPHRLRSFDRRPVPLVVRAGIATGAVSIAGRMEAR